MRLLFTRSKLPLSVFIRWGTGQPCSHFAIEFSDRTLFQSNLLGTGIEYAPYFLKHATLVHEIEVDVDPVVETKIRIAALDKFYGLGYDWGAFIYDVWRMLLKRVFGVPLRPKNLWGESDRVLCVGLAKCLDLDGMPEWVRMAVQKVPDFDVYFPEDLFQYLDSARNTGEVNISTNGHT